MVVVHDTSTNYYLDTPYVMKNSIEFSWRRASGQSLRQLSFDAGLFVSGLMDSMSPELKKHMQGKSCFNFKTVDEKLFKELTRLTKAGAARFSGKKLAQFMESIGR